MSSVNTVMTASPARCRPDTPLPEVARLMIEHDCGQIPVVDDSDVPMGVVTDRDIATRIVALDRNPATSFAGDAMTTPVVTIRADDTLKNCVYLMEDSQVRRIPVVDGDGKLVGIVSLADLALAGKKKATAEVVEEVSRDY